MEDPQGNRKQNNNFFTYVGELNIITTTFRIAFANESVHIINKNVRFGGFPAATMKNGVFWDVTPFGSC
jgi:dolichyl-phosphate-mannose--protein O-mannosyl transferase